MSRAAAFVPFGGGAAAPAPAAFRPFGVPVEGGAAVEPAETPADAEADQALRRAFQAGYEQAQQEMQAETGTIAESFVKGLEELAAFRSRLRDRYERELLEVALGVARKVVRQELAARPEVWLKMIRAAVQRAVEREQIVVRVPVPLAAFLRERMPELRKMLEDVKELEIVEDPALPQNGCIVESRFGEVDLGVDTQIDAARAALVGSEE